jgi:hypothetical protein
MAIHTFVCPECGRTATDNTSRGTHICPDDGAEMYWDLHGANLCLDGDYSFESQSMAINPAQAAEHRSLFPDIEVKPDGVISFDSVRKREKYMDRCGFHKPMSKCQPSRSI